MAKFEWNADEYTKYSSAQEKWADELLSKINLNGKEDILDLGCGDGRISVKLAGTVKEGSVVGVDSSEDMIKLAAGRFPSHKYPNLSFSVMDAKELKFTNEFDLVFSNAALHWVDDHKKVMEGIFRSLKPGGRFLIQTGGTGNAAAAFETINEMSLLSEWAPYLKDARSPYNFLSDSDYELLIPQAGFKPLRIELLTKDMVHHGIEGFKGFIRTTWLPYTQLIPEDKRERFITDTAGLYVKKYPIDEEGKVHIKMVRLEAEGVKP